jgi:hypothetical protein
MRLTIERRTTCAIPWCRGIFSPIEIQRRAVCCNWCTLARPNTTKKYESTIREKALQVLQIKETTLREGIRTPKLRGGLSHSKRIAREAEARREILA